MIGARHSEDPPPPAARPDASNPTFIFNEPRVGYRMPEGRGDDSEGTPVER